MKKVIEINKFVTSLVNELETSIFSATIESEKDKINFANTVVALKGARMLSEATEAILYNNGFVKMNGEFYQKVCDEPNDNSENENTTMSDDVKVNHEHCGE